MITAENITAWLSSSNPAIDVTALKDLIASQPYFLPARYMQAASQLAGSNYNEVCETEYLYGAHHLLFHEKLKAENTASAPTTAAEPPQEVTAGEMPVIQPVFTEDYFLHQGIRIKDAPEGLPAPPEPEKAPEDPRALMVMLSFSDWLMHFKSRSQQEKEEEDSRRALKTMWQKEKLAAALEEDSADDEIPEAVFRMAVDSVTKEDGLVSESLADILLKQGKYNKAIDMYRKLSLQNPAKSAYFASQIEAAQRLLSHD